ncbi:MAG: TRAP transporter small permease [Sphingomonadales bacterium]|nr:TRAP transporter small permease [Sphingomonadales bacterium]
MGLALGRRAGRIAGAVAEAVAVGLAGLGGAALLGLAGLVCLSALGAAGMKAGLPVAPFGFTYELIEASLPAIVFCCLPLVQWRGAQAEVALFTDRLPVPVRRWLGVLWQALVAVLMAVIAWRLGLGMGAKMRAGVSTFTLGWPLWWFYAACLPGAWAMSGVALVRAVQGARR